MSLAFNVATVGLMASFYGIFLMSKQNKQGLYILGFGHILMIGAMALKGV